jgi:hypothetical protein
VKQLPENPYGLKSGDLARVRTNLIALTADKSIDPKDRVAAAKVVTQLVDQIWKWNNTGQPIEGNETTQEAAEEVNADPLAGLKVVG